MTQVSPPMCVFCRRYQNGRICDAFPDGIPEEIFDFYYNHVNPYTGDGGIRFEPRTQFKNVVESDWFKEVYPVTDTAS